MNRNVIKLGSATWLPIVVWVALVLLLGQAAWLGRWDTVRDFLPAMTLIAWGVYVVLWAPRTVIERTQLVLRNVWSTLYLPYPRITDIRLGAYVRLHFVGADGKEHKLSLWNAPGVPRLRGKPGTGITVSGPTPRREALDRDALRQGTQKDLSGPSRAMITAWEREENTKSADQARWRIHWFEIAVTLALIAWTAYNALRR